MMMDAATAKILAALILSSTRGTERLRPSLPLQVVDRGSSWLVKGMPFEDRNLGLQYCTFSIFLDKSSARVLAIDFSGRPQLSDDEKKYWHEKLPADKFDGLFGPPTVFEPDGRYLSLNGMLYGGVINTPADAISFAYALMRSKPGLALIPKDALHAEEQNKEWHVSAIVPGQGTLREILTFSRYDGAILTGDL